MHNCVRPETKVICGVRCFSDASGLDAATKYVLPAGTVGWMQEAEH